jgi:hypothetical protein
MGDTAPMQIPTTYTAPTWIQIYGSQAYAVETVNGKAGKHPRISNGLAIAILQAWRKLGNAYKLRSPFWPDLWYHALGYRKKGDKFRLDTAWIQAPAAPDVNAAVWEYVIDTAKKLDQAKGKPLLVVLDLSYRGYEAAAKEVYAKLKTDRRIPAPPMPPGVPKPPDTQLPEIPPDKVPLPRLPKVPSLGGAGVLLLVVIVALALRKSKW